MGQSPGSSDVSILVCGFAPSERAQGQCLLPTWSVLVVWVSIVCLVPAWALTVGRVLGLCCSLVLLPPV